jgi:hypothetical protein
MTVTLVPSIPFTNNPDVMTIRLAAAVRLPAQDFYLRPPQADATSQPFLDQETDSAAWGCLPAANQPSAAAWCN